MKRRVMICIVSFVGVLAVAAGVAILLAGAPSAPGGGKPPELLLYCGAGIRPAAEALMDAFEAQHPCEVVANYAGSGRLLGQIAAVQKGELFMPGAELYVDTAIEKGLAAADTKRIVAYFVPVIFVAKGNPKGVCTLRDLGKDGLRVGLGDERACAVGRATLKILEKNGVPVLALEPNIVYKSGTVNELAAAVQLGSVDAVVVWDANARHFAAHGETVPIPPEQNVVVSIPIVMLCSARHPALARRFIEFICSPTGRTILDQRGYTTSLPESEGKAAGGEPDKSTAGGQP